MSIRVKGTEITKDVLVDISGEQLLDAITIAWSKKFNKRLDIEIQDGWLMEWTCTSPHNNDWEYERLRRCTLEEINQYNFYTLLKEILNGI